MLGVIDLTSPVDREQNVCRDVTRSPAPSHSACTAADRAGGQADGRVGGRAGGRVGGGRHRAAVFAGRGPGGWCGCRRSRAGPSCTCTHTSGVRSDGLAPSTIAASSQCRRETLHGHTTHK